MGSSKIEQDNSWASAELPKSYCGTLRRTVDFDLSHILRFDVFDELFRSLGVEESPPHFQDRFIGLHSVNGHAQLFVAARDIEVYEAVTFGSSISGWARFALPGRLGGHP